MTMSRKLKGHVMFGMVATALACFVLSFASRVGWIGTDWVAWLIAGFVALMIEWGISDWPYRWPAGLDVPIGWNWRHGPGDRWRRANGEPARPELLVLLEMYGDVDGDAVRRAFSRPEPVKLRLIEHE